jgi:hypothetical protein
LPRPGKPLKPSLKGKAPPGWAEPFFFFYPIYSEYQVQTKNRPNIFEVIVVEVVWNDGQHFGTVSKKLDKFSTFGEIAFALSFCACEALLRHRFVPGLGGRERGDSGGSF